jgi:hypothetical protein
MHHARRLRGANRAPLAAQRTQRKNAPQRVRMANNKSGEVTHRARRPRGADLQDYACRGHTPDASPRLDVPRTSPARSRPRPASSPACKTKKRAAARPDGEQQVPRGDAPRYKTMQANALEWRHVRLFLVTGQIPCPVAAVAPCAWRHSLTVACTQNSHDVVGRNDHLWVGQRPCRPSAGEQGGFVRGRSIGVVELYISPFVGFVNIL